VSKQPRGYNLQDHGYIEGMLPLLAVVLGDMIILISVNPLKVSLKPCGESLSQFMIAHPLSDLLPCIPMNQRGLTCLLVYTQPRIPPRRQYTRLHVQVCYSLDMLPASALA
jgi:hypothetical protein